MHELHRTRKFPHRLVDMLPLDVDFTSAFMDQEMMVDFVQNPNARALTKNSLRSRFGTFDNLFAEIHGDVRCPSSEKTPSLELHTCFCFNLKTGTFKVRHTLAGENVPAATITPDITYGKVGSGMGRIVAPDSTANVTRMQMGLGFSDRTLVDGPASRRFEVRGETAGQALLDAAAKGEVAYRPLGLEPDGSLILELPDDAGESTTFSCFASSKITSGGKSAMLRDMVVEIKMPKQPSERS
ncbi:hypothetical protein B0H19DRAFT_1059999 [Mycena capillaripes]|nr:hypothetical protein B0H19DRAFT_1059999 [Mycena capillaripes]